MLFSAYIKKINNQTYIADYQFQQLNFIIEQIS